MATCTIANGGGIWTDDSTWVGGAKPTNADDVVATATSGNVVISSTATARSADFTGYVGTLSGTAALNLGGAAAPVSNVALKLVAGMGCTYTGNIAFVSTVTGLTITTAGKTGLGSFTFSGVGGGWTLQDALNLGVTKSIIVTNGTFNSNAQTLTIRAVSSANANTRTVTLDGSTINTNNIGSGVSVLDLSTVTNLTWSATGTIWNIGGVHANTETFATGGKTVGTLNKTSASTNGLTITGAGTFAGMTITGAARTLTFPAGATTTVSAAPTLSGLSGSPLSIVSSTGGAAATLSVATGTVRLNHTSVKDITFAGGATFEAYDSVSVSGNTDLTFKTARRLSLMGVG